MLAFLLSHFELQIFNLPNRRYRNWWWWSGVGCGNSGRESFGAPFSSTYIPQEWGDWVSVYEISPAPIPVSPTVLSKGSAGLWQEARGLDPFSPGTQIFPSGILHLLFSATNHWLISPFLQPQMVCITEITPSTEWKAPDALWNGGSFQVHCLTCHPQKTDHFVCPHGGKNWT